jgi:GNAT superfamily N-acetyltransferase
VAASDPGAPVKGPGNVQDMGMDASAPYPTEREADVALRDGSTIHVRPVRSDDQGAILRFLSDLSGESLYLRFFSGSPDLKEAAARAASVDYRSRYGLVATAGPEARVIAHAMYLQSGPGRAEVALAIADAYQGRGIGTILLGHLAEAAGGNGIDVFEARILPQNHRMV